MTRKEKDSTKGVLSVFDFVQSRKYYGLQIPIESLTSSIQSWWAYQKYQCDKLNPNGFIQGRKTGLHLNFLQKYRIQLKRDTDGGTIIQMDYWARIRKTGIAAAFITYGVTAALGAGTLSYWLIEARNFLKDFWKWFDGNYQVVNVQVTELVNEENSSISALDKKNENVNNNKSSSTKNMTTTNNYYNTYQQQHPGQYPPSAAAAASSSSAAGQHPPGGQYYNQQPAYPYQQQQQQGGYTTTSHQSVVYGMTPPSYYYDPSQQAAYPYQQQQQGGYPSAPTSVSYDDSYSGNVPSSSSSNNNMNGSQSKLDALTGGSNEDLINQFSNQTVDNDMNQGPLPPPPPSATTAVNAPVLQTAELVNDATSRGGSGSQQHDNSNPPPPPPRARTASVEAPLPQSAAQIDPQFGTGTSTTQDDHIQKQQLPSSSGDSMKHGGLGFGYSYSHLKADLDKKFHDRQSKINHQGSSSN